MRSSDEQKKEFGNMFHEQKKRKKNNNFKFFKQKIAFFLNQLFSPHLLARVCWPNHILHFVLIYFITKILALQLQGPSILCSLLKTETKYRTLFSAFKFQSNCQHTAVSSVLLTLNHNTRHQTVHEIFSLTQLQSARQIPFINYRWCKVENLSSPLIR